MLHANHTLMSTPPHRNLFQLQLMLNLTAKIYHHDPSLCHLSTFFSIQTDKREKEIKP